MTDVKELSFRDKLALDRTYLARERTRLAYIRTGVALIGLAFFVYRFVEIRHQSRLALLLLIALPGVYAVAYEIKKELAQRKDRKKFEEKIIIKAENGE